MILGDTVIYLRISSKGFIVQEEGSEIYLFLDINNNKLFVMNNSSFYECRIVLSEKFYRERLKI